MKLHDHVFCSFYHLWYGVPEKRHTSCSSSARVRGKQKEHHHLRKIYIRYWNVRTRSDVGNQAVIMRMLNDYQVDIASLSKVRLNCAGSRNSKVLDADNHYWVYGSEPGAPDKQ